MKYPNSVWTFGYRPRYYLTHPWKFIKEVRYNIRDMFQRIRYGWCISDTWDIDNWLMLTLPNMLRHMADKGHSYPGRSPFETPEQWHEWLHKMADLLESGLEDKQNECNEYYKEYIKALEGREIGDGISAADREYFDRANEIAEDAQHNIEVAFRELSKNFFNLWD